jgi:hypothetical protein
MYNVQLKSTQGIGARQGVKALVYGKAGMGKTTLCATAPNPMIISAEAGLLSLSRFNLPYAEVKTVQDLTNLHMWALQSSEARQFQTICLDSISEIAETVLTNAKIKAKDGRLAYGDMNEQMINVIKVFRDLQGFNVLMTAKQEYVKDEQTGQMLNMPSMPGKTLTRDLPYFFDEVFKIDIGLMTDGSNRKFRYLLTQPDFSNDAKDRSGRLAPMEEPHLGKLFAKINS